VTVGAAALGHACPKCGSAVGQRCYSPGRDLHVVHLVRRALGSRYAGEFISRREERELKRFNLPTFQLSPPPKGGR
jgi:hypothetical protein